MMPLAFDASRAPASSRSSSGRRSHAQRSVAPSTHLSAADTATTPGSEWVQVWSDEFDGDSGTSFDAARWSPDLGDGCAAGICGWGNQEKEYYTTEAENIALDGHGHLMIVARAAPSGLTCYYGACRYTSAKVHTRGKVSASPGLVEARLKLPVGQGLWPAFWMLGANFPATAWPRCGELDIMEYRGSQPATTSSAIHGPGYSGNTPFAHAKTRVGENYSADFHKFSVAWDSMRVRFFVDDTLHYRLRRTDVERFGVWVFDQPFFLILNLAVGGHFDGDPQSDAILPATMLVDYVRVYRPAP
jgi:beta-glucanase (GH16 family)